MCGRIAQGRSAQALAPIYPGLLFEGTGALPEGDELGPGQPIALVHGAGAPTLAPTRWGLVTSWTRAGRPLLHARAESATSKPTFRDATRRRRAVAPCEGWTEWRTTGGPRHRYWARRPGANAPLSIAALTWGGPGAVTAKCVLVTAAAAASMAIVHHRQPLCLEDDEVSAWLDPATPLADIEAILAAGGAREPGVTLVRADEGRG